MTQHEQGLVAENAALRAELEALRNRQCLHEIQEPAVNQQLTNAQIDEVFSCLPEGAMGFLKSWGYRQFARKLMSLYAATVQAAPAAVAAPDEAQIKALMRKHRIWIEHSTLFEDDEPPRELRAVQAEQHQFESFVQDLIALAAAPAAAAPVVLPEPAGEVVAKLLELARIVDRAVDDWGESHADGSSTVIFQKDEADARDAILDYFDSLPENPDPLILDSRPIKAMRALLATATGLPAQAYQDSTPQLHVGESSFEGWYAGYVKEGTVSLKQNCRDAYAAGMGDPLVVSAPQAQADARDAELLGFLQDQCIDLRCFTTSDGEDVGWRTVQHHMSEPRERVVSEVYGDQPRRAIREAMARIERDPYCTGPLHLEDDAAIAAAKGE